jgi:hypothetical protein
MMGLSGDALHCVYWTVELLSCPVSGESFEMALATIDPSFVRPIKTTHSFYRAINEWIAISNVTSSSPVASQIKQRRTPLGEWPDSRGEAKLSRTDIG